MHPTEPNSVRVGGSFRDPTGYVFLYRNSVYRAISSNSSSLYNEIVENQLLDKLVQQNLLIESKLVQDETLVEKLQSMHPEFNCFFEHKTIQLISYPYEWCFSMLADAALHTLKLHKLLLKHQLGLKDATAYNIQFVNTKPLFIDLTSIEKPMRMDIWYALGQFNQMFLFPLLLKSYRGWDFRSYFLSEIGGHSIEQIYSNFSFIDRFRPALLLDLTLTHFLHQKHKKSQKPAQIKRSQNTDSKAQLINIDRLSRKITKIKSKYTTDSAWSSYTSICNYSSSAETHKKELIKKFLERRRPTQVLDLGCNTGDYSYLAAETGAEVIAVDLDHDAIERLYRKLQKKPAQITPLVIDLSQPSPAIGFMNQERDSFIERISADCVMALALVHHLRVSGNLLFENIVELFCKLSSKYLILEFIDQEDSMFQQLIEFRTDSFADFSLSNCKDCFSKAFNLIEEHSINDSKRTLLIFERKN